MNVLILGLGQYPKGSGIAAALYFARRGDDVTVTDMKDAKALAANVKQLKRFKNVRFVLGRHDLKDIHWADLIVRNPRVREDSPEMREAKRLKRSVVSDISLFLDSCPARVIGVTGTRGKSTTSTLIAEMLRVGAGLVPAQGDRKGRPYNRHVWLGGNILVSPLTFLPEVKPNDWVVLELSSWQLEATGDVRVSPPIAVWTNLMRDHLNTYKNMRAYAEAKAQIFLHQWTDGVVFLPADRSFDAFAKRAKGNVVRFGKARSPEVKFVHSVKLKLLGEHNARNAEIAAAVAFRLGVSPAAIKRVLRSFGGLPGRLELIAEKKGVRYVNDTTSTTPDATMAAINALSSQKGRVHLIFGGSDKELIFDGVARLLKKKNVDVVVLAGNAREKIAKAFKKAKLPFCDARDLKTALAQARMNAKKGDVILLSPGCTSFGMFKNEFDRGEVFKQLVGTLR